MGVESMDASLVVAIVIILILVAVALFAKGSGGSREFPYRLKKSLLSKAERSFYGVLVQAVNSNGLVFTKVRVADVLQPGKGLRRSVWQRAFNKICSKHFDFLLCDPKDCSVKLAIELDDSSHGSTKTQQRDHFLNAACESAGLPLLRIKAARSYTLTELREKIKEAISPFSNASPEVEPRNGPLPEALKQSGIVETAPTASDSASGSHKDESIHQVSHTQDVAAPPCPKCGEPMLLRKAKSGANIGKEFWGCSAFPKCRGVAALT